MKIIDCFIFYNELELLNYRLNILYNIVDYFIIVESKYTFTGKEKKLIYNENKERFSYFNDKIIYICLDDMPYKYPYIDYLKREQWENEYYQRNSIKNGFANIDIKDNDIIIISDVDEIPDPNTLINIKEQRIRVNNNSLEMDFYYYNLNSKINSKWTKAKLILYKTFCNLNMSCNDIRMSNSVLIKNGGWHLSYFGDCSFIKNKIQNFSHQEFNNENYTNCDIIKKRIENSEDLFGRKSGCDEIIKLDENDNTYLPYNYEKYLKHFLLH
jgi:beta-1,4-mannosyl-glycoprotein beta-1,4-N-acetylglucosaminyltransferase